MIFKSLLFCAAFYIFQVVSIPIKELNNPIVNNPIQEAINAIHEKLSLPLTILETSEIRGTHEYGDDVVEDTSLRSSSSHGMHSSLNSIGYFGLGLYGAGVFDRYAKLYKQLRKEQENAIEYKNQLQQPLGQTYSDLLRALQTNKEVLLNRVQSLIFSVNEHISSLQSQGQDVSCFDTFDARIEEIRTAISALDVDLISYQVGNKTNILLTEVIGWYGKVLGICTQEYPILFTQIRDIELCVADNLRVLENEKEIITTLVETDTRTLVNAVTMIMDSTQHAVSALIVNVNRDFLYRLTCT